MKSTTIIPVLSILALTACSKKDDVCARGSDNGIETIDQLEAVAECETIEGWFYIATAVWDDSDARQPSSVIKEVVDHDDAQAQLDLGQWPWSDLSFFENLEHVEGPISLPSAPTTFTFPSLSFATEIEAFGLVCPSAAEDLLVQLGVSEDEIAEAVAETNDCSFSGEVSGMSFVDVPVSTPSRIVIERDEYGFESEVSITCQEYWVDYSSDDQDC